jgi:hypothetical protein
MKKYNYLYVNGSSFTAGGGLEPKKDDLRSYYKTHYNLEWKSERDISWPKLLADKLGVTLIDESKCGGGPERVVRMVYDFLFKSGGKAHDTLFILEIPSAYNRIDVYSNHFNKYLICNPNYNISGKKAILEDMAITQGHHEYEDYDEVKLHIYDSMVDYLTKFHNIDEYSNKISTDVIGLYSLLRNKNLLFYLTHSGFDAKLGHFYQDVFEKHFFPFKQNDFFNWASHNKKTILDETNGVIDDKHPGYFAHKEWADILYNFLTKDLEDSKN